MKNKIKRKMHREELADYLEQLATALRNGNFETKDRCWLIPDKLEAKISHKEKKGRIDTKIKWRWSTLEQYEKADREAVITWQDSWKAVKKRLAQSFKAIEKAVAAGNMPDVETLAAFVSESRQMAKFAEAEWQAAMDEYIDHLGTLKQAVAQDQFEVVQHEIRDLKNRMMQCHRDFK